ncbi:lanosterol synthase, partial [Ramaria rubella]
GNIMIEYNYPECTTSVLTALSIFKRHYPQYRRGDIESTTRRAITYIHNAQHPCGGWFGSWGISFTYATMFALESLALVRETYETSTSVRKACDFLVGKQRGEEPQDRNDGNN